MIPNTKAKFSLERFGFPSLNRENIECLGAIAGLCAVPLSIAVSETLLAIALLSRVANLFSGRSLNVPRVCWLWLGWAGLEVLSWLRSPQITAGWGEMRHLLLIAALFVILPALGRYRVAAWRGILVTSTVGSAALLINTGARWMHYRSEIAAGGDAGFLLRNGGFLHHWMIYATVEVLVFGALLEFRSLYPQERRWTTVALWIHCLAALFSFTRILWIACFLIAAVHLLWRRSKWILALPVIVGAAFLLAPDSVRTRIAESSHPDYYSNAERVQMWHVGWRMIREHPLFGVGPGRVEELYPSYLSKSELVPAYRGHLHNNGLQLAAQFGLPVLGAALLWLAILVVEVLREHRRAQDRDARFLCRSALLGVAGFVVVGMTDYTYGHALGLILCSFVSLAPLLKSGNPPPPDTHLTEEDAKSPAPRF